MHDSELSSTQTHSSGRLLLIGGMILAAALFRLVPHPPNFTPIGAMALFGGAAIANRRLAFALPLLAMLLSDLFLEFDSSRLWVYGSIALITLLGRTLQGHRNSAWRVACGSLGASLVFFVVTNFGVWAMSGWYTHTLSELGRCFAMALPFFRYTVIGDLVFSGVLFGGLAFLESRASVTSNSAVES